MLGKRCTFKNLKVENVDLVKTKNGKFFKYDREIDVARDGMFSLA